MHEGPLLLSFSSGLSAGGVIWLLSASLCCCQGRSHISLYHLPTSASYNGTLRCCNLCRCALQAERASPVMMMPPSLCPSLTWFCRPPAGPATLCQTHMLRSPALTQHAVGRHYLLFLVSGFVLSLTGRLSVPPVL